MKAQEATKEARRQSNWVGFAQLMALLLIIAAIAVSFYGTWRADDKEKRAAVPGKVQRFNRDFPYKITEDEVLNPSKISVKHELIQNLINKEFTRLLADYDLKDKEVKALVKEQNGIRSTVANDGEEIAKLTAKYDSMTGQIQKAKQERDAIKAIWEQKGSDARDCGFEASSGENRFNSDLESYRDSLTKGKAGLGHPSPAFVF